MHENIFKIWQKLILTNLIKLGLCQRKTSLFYLSQTNRTIKNFQHFLLQTIERCRTPKLKSPKKTKNFVYDIDNSINENVEKSLLLSQDLSQKDSILEIRQKSPSKSTKSPLKKSPPRSP